MQPVNAATFVRNDHNDRLLFEESVDLVQQFLNGTIGGIHGWTPVTPGPPPIYTARLSGQLVNRAPVRLKSSADAEMPQRQDTRQTSNTERVSILFNALLRRADIIRVGIQDFRLSWIPPSMAGADAPIGTLFLDTSTGLLSIKDINGVVIPIGSGGVISFDFGGP